MGDLRLKSPLTDDSLHLFLGAVGEAVLVFDFEFAVSTDVVGCGLHVLEAANVGTSDLQHDFRCPSDDARKFLPGSQPYESRAAASPTFTVGVCDMPLVIPHGFRE